MATFYLCSDTLALPSFDLYGLSYNWYSVIYQKSRNLYYFNSQIQIPSLAHSGYLLYSGLGTQFIYPTHVIELYSALGYNCNALPDTFKKQVFLNIGLEYIHPLVRVVKNVYLSSQIFSHAPLHSPLQIDIQASYTVFKHYKPFLGGYYFQNKRIQGKGFIAGIAIDYSNFQVQLKQVWGNHALQGFSLTFQFHALNHPQMQAANSGLQKSIKRFLIPNINASPDSASIHSSSTSSTGTQYYPPFLSVSTMRSESSEEPNQREIDFSFIENNSQNSAARRQEEASSWVTASGNPDARTSSYFGDTNPRQPTQSSWKD